MIRAQLLGAVRLRHLIYRSFRHFGWRIKGQKFATGEQANFDGITWVEFECPVVNHPTQQHLIESKLFNMRIAVQRFDGVVLQPGEIFSYWNLIGRPSSRAGFRAGPTFENGQMVTSYGGGLCQISGLIFNLALEAGCEILERSSHSLDAYGERRYLPLGRDATVAWISKDLAFKNSTGLPIKLVLGLENTRAFGRIEGPASKPFQIRIHRSDFESPRSTTKNQIVDALVTREISLDGKTWSPHGRFQSQYRMLEKREYS